MGCDNKKSPWMPHGLYNFIEFSIKQNLSVSDYFAPDVPGAYFQAKSHFISCSYF
jgi:hypothetical protein